MTSRTKEQSFAIRFGRNFVRKWRNEPMFSTVIVLILMIICQTIALGFDYPSFGNWFSSWCGNWLNILRNNAGIGIVALGMTFVIISGGIDLSVGSILVAVGAVLMLFINSNPAGFLTGIGISGVPAYIIGILIALFVGALLGSINGFLIAKCRLPAFIATLGMMKICRSVTQNFMQTVGTKVPSQFRLIVTAPIGGEIVLPILYWLITALVLYTISKKTAFGRHIYAIGSNERAARLAGISVSRIKALVYVLCGILVAITTIIQVARIGSMDYANAGSGYEMDAIAATVVGGTNMAGGKGSVWGTVLGTLIIAVMNNLLNLLGVPAFLREAFKGFIVICAVLLQKKESQA